MSAAAISLEANPNPSRISLTSSSVKPRPPNLVVENSGRSLPRNALPTDFGCSKQIQVINSRRTQATKRQIGTVEWVDPVFYCTAPNDFLTYNEKSDIYSLGVMFWSIATRELPFKGIIDNKDEIPRKVLSEPV